MDHRGLAERLGRVPGVRELPGFAAFDPADDRHVDQLAAHLLERFRQHQDVEAFTALFELTHERLAEAAARLSRQLAPGVEPDDLVSCFMARLFCDLPGRGAEPVRRFLGLAYTAMRNDVLDQLRQRRRALAKDRAYQDALAAPADPSRLIADAEQERTLERCGLELLRITADCFHELAPRDQQVLVAREILHLSYDRVAAMLGLDGGQVGMIIRRARQHLVRRIGRRLAGAADAGEVALSGRELAVLRGALAATLDRREHTRGVKVLLERMLERSAASASRRLADLVYEMVKACLMRQRGFADRTLVHAHPRPPADVARDIHRMRRRLEAVGGRRGAPAGLDAAVEHAVTAPESEALEDAERCLELLEALEGPSGRQLVALALCRIHAGRPREGEEILDSLRTRELPAITRQNVSRNLTLALLRQERYAEARAEAEHAAALWPDDPVRLMNLCFATARLGARDEFEQAVRDLGRVQRAALQHDDTVPGTREGTVPGTVERWIAGALVDLAVAVGVPLEHLGELLAGRGGRQARDRQQARRARNERPPRPEPTHGSGDEHPPTRRAGRGVLTNSPSDGGQR